MPNIEFTGQYFCDDIVIDLDFAHYMLKYDFPVSGDELKKMGVK